MFIKQRSVRRSEKFSSRWVRSSQRRREYVATLYTTGVVQLVLFVFLIIGAHRSWVLMQQRFGDVVWYGRAALPFLLLIIAALVGRAVVNNVLRVRETYQHRQL